MFETDEQKREHISAIVNATASWGQGYSEPGSGSDLASLQTRADRDGDEYVLNGSKIWSSNAHLAEWAYVLARTDQDAVTVQVARAGSKPQPVQITFKD